MDLIDGSKLAPAGSQTDGGRSASSPDRRWLLHLVWLTAAVILAAALGVRYGTVPISNRILWHIITGQKVEPAMRTILLQMRLPRVLLAIGAGAGLAASGVAWQGVLRNPLADPYLIGVSAGGALGAGMAIAFDLQWPGGVSAVPACAFAGALLAVGVVLALAGTRQMRIERLILAGVAVGAFLSACLAVLLVWKSNRMPAVYFWMMGSLAPPRGWPDLLRAAPYLAVGWGVLLVFAGPMNVLQLGPERAHSLGIDPRRAQLALIAAATLLASTVVATCGMIGFVGLVVPHMARMLVGPDLRRTLPVATLAGALLLILADLIARLAGEIPVGVVTAFLGAPFFLFLVLRERSA